MKPIKPLVLLLVCALIFADVQAGNKGNNRQGTTRKKEGKKVPIDGGISLLVAAGAALGAKKVFQKNQQKVS